MKYNADFFIEGFTDIPDKFWCTGVDDNGKWKFCALGHLGIPSPEAKALSYLLIKAVGDGAFPINDGLVKKYSQPTPKARILAALEDAKKKGL